MASVYTVILAGGAGSRLWPLSRETYPKQMLKLDDSYTLFQQTFLRAASVIDDKNIITATNVKHASAIKQQLKELQEKFCRKKEYITLTEPIIKNTAPALTLAVKYIQEKTKEQINIPIIIVLPSDHIITNRQAFADFIEKGIKLAKSGYIVTYSQETDTPTENFGYIKARKNRALSELEPDALKVSKFIEKPVTKEDLNNLKGKLYINTGIYIFSIQTYMEEMKKYGKDILNTVINAQISEKQPSIALNIYEKLPDISIDYILMEKSKNLVTIPFKTNWKDIGSWDAIYDISGKDKNGNYRYGNTVEIDTKDSLIYSTSKLVGTIGLRNKIVAETEDAVLIADLKKPNGIKKIYKKLNGRNAAAKDIHKTVYRPWGYYEVLEEGEGFLTKCITVNPESKLSLQRHQFRSEHWIIVEGIATVVKDGKTYTLTPGNSIDIGVHEIHSLQNTHKEELKVIEIQQGDKLEENDIERLEDIYGRV